MKPSIIVLLAAAGLGSAYWLGTLRTAPEPTADSKAAATPSDPATADLQRRLDQSARRIASLERRLADAQATPPPAAPPANDVEALVREARPLIDRLTPTIERAMERGLEQQIARWAKELGLDEQQTERLRERMSALARDELARLGEGLDNPETWRNRRPGGMGPGGLDPDAVSKVMKETLTPDQFKQYERKQAENRANIAQRSADFQVERLGRRLNLTEDQKDKVFDWVVRSNNPDLAVETASGGANLPVGISQEEGIRRLLTPEQREIYDQDLARRREAGERWRGRAPR